MRSNKFSRKSRKSRKNRKNRKDKKDKKNRKNDKTKKSELIGKGSYGCVFRPSIPCKKYPSKKKTRKKSRVSKVFIKKDAKSALKEFEMNKIIRKIPNYKEWSYTWKEMCEPPSYKNIKKIAEIDICLKKIDLDKKEYNKGAYMLIGEYGGITLTKYAIKLFPKSAFKSKRDFIKSFMKLFKLIEPIFKGVNELNKRKISHMDLSRGNIMIKDNKCYIIDFGLSCRYNNKINIKKRSIKQVEGSRIYDPYPLDFIYAFATNENKKDEINAYQSGNFRTNYDDYLLVHKEVFHRKNIEEDIFINLTTKSEKEKIIENLDTYSVGYLVPQLLVELSEYHTIGKKQLLKCFNYTEIQNHLALFKDMTEYDSVNRIPIREAYERFKSLL